MIVAAGSGLLLIRSKIRPCPPYRSRTSTPRTQYGRRAQSLARHRNAGRRLRQAHHRHRQLLYPVRSRPRSSEGPGPTGRREIESAGGVAKEFNTIAIDDGIAMGHDGMLYSLPSRELIADSVEYMVNAHCADALVCISNCDKITPGMLMAALRLNIPADLRFRRAHGSGQGAAGRRRQVRGPDRRHDRRRRPPGQRRGGGRVWSAPPAPPAAPVPACSPPIP